MKVGGQKAKGKKYEDKIAKMLQSHFIENHTEYRELFEKVGNDELKPKRDFSSGTTMGAHGDINLNLLKNYFPYSIECKHWASLDVTINAILKGKLTSLESIWKAQAVPKANHCKLHPLVVFSGNRTEIFCMIEARKDIIDSCVSSKFNYVRSHKHVIMLFKDFLTLHTI